MDARSAPTLTVSYLVRAAQAYLARRAASRLQLAQVLLRKARRVAGEDQETDAEAVRTLVEAAVERVALAGWINDGMLAQARAASLARSGLPASAVRRRLVHQGFGREMPDDQLLAIDDESQARRYAERKRLGPFASGRRAVSPERDLRAMIRAGFSPALSKRVLNTLSQEIMQNGASGPDDENMNTS